MNFSHTFITGGNYLNQNTVNTHHIVQNPIKGGFERLQDAVAPGAFHNSGERFDPPKCHRNTRLAVLKRLMDWILRQDPDTRDALLMWLYGPAGAGKSAIAQTLAEMCHTEGRLLASFFFARNNPVRGTAQRLVATLAYQLALKLPQQVREDIILAIDHDPLIFTLSLEAQLTALIVQPVSYLAESGFFNNLDTPRLIIIDGLDECDDRKVQSHIIHTIFRVLQQQHLPLLFLIASRPEADIFYAFNSHSSTLPFTTLALDGSYRPDKDIRVFLKDQFHEIKQTHRLKNYIPSSWPMDEVMDGLVHKSSGQFIYASTVVRFVSSARHRPTNRLEIILGIRPASGEAPFAELDALYTQIFSTVDDIANLQNIMGLLILVPISVENTEFLEYFLSLDPGDLPLILSDLGSLISLDEGRRDIYLHILHASLEDFFLDPSRSKNLYINPVKRHAEYSRICFKHLKNNSLNGHTLRRLFYHSSLSPVSQELRDNIVGLSAESMADALAKNAIFNQGYWLSRFWSFLESLTWDTDKRIYQDQLELFDQFFMRQLDKYYSNSFLLLRVATLTNKYARRHQYDTAFPRGARIVDEDGLLQNLCSFSLYREPFTNFLEDPLRARKYFLDNTKYASAAIVALTLTSVSSHWSHPLPAVHSDPDKNIRRNAPRRWLEKWGRKSVLFTLRMKYKPEPRTPQHRYFHPHPYGSQTGHYYSNMNLNHMNPAIHFNVRKNPWKKHNHARAIFWFALFNLPYLLERAGKSHELIDLARQMQFGPRGKSYTKRVRWAKEAIKKYLARYSDEM